MRYKLLDCVVLRHDLPEYKLRAGDLGTIVQIYEPDGLEVEFVKASGDTLVVTTLLKNKVRSIKPADILSVRPLVKAA